MVKREKNNIEENEIYKNTYKYIRNNCLSMVSEDRVWYQDKKTDEISTKLEVGL